MAEEEASAELEPAIDVFFDPQLAHPDLPIEVVDRQPLMARMPERHLRNLQRARFHQLVVCTGGSGRHHVDFHPFELSMGKALHIRPGQVQKFEAIPEFDACMVIWPVEHDPQLPYSQPWYPGSLVPTEFELDQPNFQRLTRWIDDLRFEQARFGESLCSGELMRTMLSTVLMLINDIGGRTANSAEMPQAYLDLREVMERRLFERLSVSDLAGEIGYSSRTLDRACGEVSGQTAKQVVDERLVLELRRLLADRSRAISDIREAFGFDDSSNFTKFVRRHLNQSPGDFRRDIH